MNGAQVGGGCACGRVRYLLSQPPLAVRVCWCRDCQYFAAGNASVNLRLPRAAVSIDGEVRGWETKADSGNVVRRSFCTHCGVSVFSENSAAPDILVIRAGTLDDPGLYPPQQNIWTASAPRWACIDTSLPGTAGQPG